MSEYPLFLPPEKLAQKGRDNWTEKEANEYKIWLVSNLEKRTNYLLNYLSEKSNETENIEEFLKKIGKKVSGLLFKDEFSENTEIGRRLTNKGLALAADMGLLVANFLLKSCGDKIYWKIIRKPKSDMSYNLPVIEIKGFDYMDPIGGSISETKAILRGVRDHEIWHKIYVFWKEKTKQPNHLKRK